MKESMEHASSDLLNESYLEQSGTSNNAHDDDIVVDAIDGVVTTADKEFVINPGQILGLDQAILQSIDRCRKLSVTDCFEENNAYLSYS